MPVPAKIAAISLFVESIERSRIWYQTVFACTVDFEDDVSCVLKFENVLINLLLKSAAIDLIAPATVATPVNETHAQFSIWFDNVDQTIAELASKGVSMLNGPIDRPWGLRTAALTDPDGHNWELAQAIA